MSSSAAPAARARRARFTGGGWGPQRSANRAPWSRTAHPSITTTEAPPSVKDRPGTVILQTGSDSFSRDQVARALQLSLPDTAQHLILHEPIDGNFYLTTMEPDLISVASLVDTTITIGSRSLTMIDMAHRQVAPVVELKLIGVFSNPAHGYDHVAS
ncbi:hypothetical protein V1505DRAFT_391643, partial [Lipomyces doorenjongii]